jgi:uncharacterized delta-60 repeat protein
LHPFEDTVERLLPDGTPDAAFGTNGSVNIDLGANNGGYPLDSIDVAASGQILVSSPSLAFRVAELQPNGSLNPAFGVGGLITSDPHDSPGRTSAVISAAFGPGATVFVNTVISIDGQNVSDSALEHYNADGSVDSSYGTSGIVVNSQTGSVAVVVLSDGAVLVESELGPLHDTAGITKFSPSGVLDTTFGVSGTVSFLTPTPGTDAALVIGVGIEPDNSIIVATGADLTGGFGGRLYRLDSDGNLDSSFGTGGFEDVAPDQSEAPIALSTMPDGRILLVEGSDDAIDRYLPADVTLGMDGTLIAAGSATDDTISFNVSSDSITCTFEGTTKAFDAANVSGIFAVGGLGNDSIDASAMSIPVTLRGGPGSDTLTGGSGNDSLRGGNSNDSLVGGPGNDTIRGRTENDTIDGGSGDDLLYGGEGDDSILGADGADTLYGRAGSDHLDGGPGNDAFFTDDGNTDTVFGGGGSDTAHADGLDSLTAISTVL